LKRLKSIIFYLVTLAIAGGLFWYAYKDTDFNQMLSEMKTANYNWILFSIILAILSHIIRAYRWQLLLKPLGFHINLFRAFLAVMVGYFANILVPRMGEVTRCGILKRTDNVSIPSSFGTVVGERLIDLICLIIIVVSTLIIEFDVISDYFFGFFENKIAILGRNLLIVYFVAGILMILLLLFFIFLKSIKQKVKSWPLYLKIRSFLKEVGTGIASVSKVDDKLAFFVSTILIWVLYYFMSYVVVFSLEETSHLSLLAGLSILTMGSLGISAPVQGGIGTYHILVASVLVTYGISDEIGKLFAAIMHSAQILMIVVVGGVSFIISIFISGKKNKLAKEQS
jgi:glycosyltransferase 2 family protein